MTSSQSFTTRSCPAEARYRLSGLNATAATAAAWPRRICPGLPVAASQSRTVLSSPAVAIHRPSAL